MDDPRRALPGNTFEQAVVGASDVVEDANAVLCPVRRPAPQLPGQIVVPVGEAAPADVAGIDGVQGGQARTSSAATDGRRSAGTTDVTVSGSRSTTPSRWFMTKNGAPVTASSSQVPTTTGTGHRGAAQALEHLRLAEDVVGA